MDAVLIPTFNRPEFLTLALDCILHSDIPKGMTFVFQIDYGHDPDVVKVIDRFDNNLVKKYGQNAPKIVKSFTLKSKFPSKSKLSYNILTGYRNAVGYSDRYVYMIEDDVMIGESFWQFHEWVHDHSDTAKAFGEGGLFCSIGSKNPNREVKQTNDVKLWYTSSGDYASVGVCFHKDVLKDIVLPHANEKYFSFPARYIKNTIGLQGISAMYPEQAGLIRRLQIKSGLPIAFPYVPRAFHSGFYGKNRKGYEIKGTLEDRIDAVRDIAFNIVRLRETVKERWVRDSEPCSLEAYDERLMFDQHYS